MKRWCLKLFSDRLLLVSLLFLLHSTRKPIQVVKGLSLTQNYYKSTKTRIVPVTSTVCKRKWTSRLNSKDLKNNQDIKSRRSFMATSIIAGIGTVASTYKSTNGEELIISEVADEIDENSIIGKGKWSLINEMNQPTEEMPASFVTYATRFLINYDAGVRSTWEQQKEDDFASIAMSVQLSFERFLTSSYSENNTTETTKTKKQRYNELAIKFLETYGSLDDDVPRQIGLLFSLLPVQDQPIDFLFQLKQKIKRVPIITSNRGIIEQDFFTTLLPSIYTFSYQSSIAGFIITPPILTSFQAASPSSSSYLSTPFGPRGNAPLTRALPSYNMYIYTLLGLSGGISCALTHSIVIPLDVVKTRLQTESASQQRTSLLNYSKYIYETEGIQALLLGSSPTIVGFFWYGISVYPSYLFLKRFILSLAIPTLQEEVISILAGAMASVIASIGLTPMEACRIRTVADPTTYRPLGLVKTLQKLQEEQELYSGFPSLVTRQVIFGSIKFLTFERTVDLLESTLYLDNSLGISLLAGAVAGCLSSIISHPADTVLTFIAKQSSSQKLGIINGAVVMLEQEGIQALLFRGLGSRCIWATCIIAGQFFFYDLFRTIFGVAGDQLTQVYEVFIS